MRTIRAIAIFAVFVLVLTCTAGMVSAGVEPSPFKSKTIVNRLNVAQNRLGVIDSMLDRIEGKATELDNRGTLVSAGNQVNILPGIAYGTLRCVESAQAMFQDVEYPDIGDYSEALEELRKYDELLKDKVLGLEQNPNLPKAAKMALRQLAGILQDIQNVVDEFLSGNVD